MHAATLRILVLPPVLVIGSERPWVEACALRQGARKVTTLDQAGSQHIQKEGRHGWLPWFVVVQEGKARLVKDSICSRSHLLSPAVLQELEQKQRGLFCTGQCMQISITCYLYGKYIDYHSQQRAGCLERVL